MASPERQRCDVKIKMLMLGDGGVGKTCIIRQFVDAEFEDILISTVGKIIDTHKLAIYAACMHACM